MPNDYASDFYLTRKDGSALVGGGHNDASTGLAVTRGYVLDFFHVPTGRHVAFKAMINSFNDQYTSEWSSESVYGRMDPISQFQGTQRVISLDWDVVAGSVEEAKQNMNKIQLLMSMLYPTYEASPGDSSATLISTAPLFKFKFGNFAMDSSKGSEAAAARAEEAGLVGYIGGFTFEPDFESGIMEDMNATFGPPGSVHGMGHFFPQHIKLSAEFTVLHTHKLGFEGSDKRSPNFPYAANSGGAGGASGADEGPTAEELDDWAEAVGIEIGGA